MRGAHHAVDTQCLELPDSELSRKWVSDFRNTALHSVQVSVAIWKWSQELWNSGNKTYRRRQWWEQSAAVKSRIQLTCPAALAPPGTTAWSVIPTCLTDRIQTCQKTVIQQLWFITHHVFAKQTHISLCLLHSAAKLNCKEKKKNRSSYQACTDSIC